MHMASMDLHSRAAEFMNELGDPGCLLLIEQLSDVLFWVKDKSGRYVTVNRRFLDFYALVSLEEIVGKLDHDFTPAYLADGYVADDEQVLKGAKIVNRKELIHGVGQAPRWFRTSKVPLLGKNGKIVGTAGMARADEQPSAASSPEFSGIIKFIRDNLGESITVPMLAKQASMSVSAFERHFKKRFGLTAIAYIRRTRVNRACRMLEHSSSSLADIAIATGFCDQSHMTKVFRQLVGCTPRDYALRYKK